MRASYTINKTPDNLTRIGTAPWYISFLIDGETNWDYERRAKHFYETKENATIAGKRYLLKMKKNGFEV